MSDDNMSDDNLFEVDAGGSDEEVRPNPRRVDAAMRVLEHHEDMRNLAQLELDHELGRCGGDCGHIDGNCWVSSEVK